MSTSIARLAIDLVVNSAGLQKDFSKALRPMQKFGREMTAIGKDLSMKVTAPIAGLGIGILKAAGDFEAGMNRVQAITGATSDQFISLRDRAKELGATTQFSATEAAAGIEMLAKNGLKYQSIVDGALEATLKLSAATGSDLARAADIATDAMLAFGIQAKDMEGAVNAITGVTLNSKFDIEGYAYAMAGAGGVAAAVGVEFDDFNATIAAMAPAFSSGMTAGTSLKTFLARLKPTSKPAIEAMASLKLSFFNAAGEMDSMATIADKLQKSFGGLSEEDKLAKGIQIFGTEGVRAAFAIMNAGSESIENLKKSLAETSAADQATARMKGLNGAMIKLKSALEAVAIAIADSGLLEWATIAVEKFTGWFSIMSQTNPEVLKAATVVAGLAAALGPLIVVLGSVVAAGAPLVALISAKGGLIASVALLANPLTGLVAILGGLVIAWAKWGDEIDRFLTDYFANLIVAFDPLIEKLSEAGDAFFSFVTSWQSKLEGWDVAMHAAFLKIGGYILNAGDYFANFMNVGQNVFKQVGLYVEQMVARVQNWLADKLLKITEKAGAAVEKLKGKFYDLANAVVFNSYIPDMVDLLGDEFKRMESEFVNPSIDSLKRLQDEFKKTENAGSGITIGPALPPKKDEQPFDASEIMMDIKKGKIERFNNLFDSVNKTIGPDQFKLPTSKATKEAQAFEKQISTVLNSQSQQSIDQLVSKYERMGTDIGEGILSIGNGLDGAEDKFKSFGKNITGQFDDILSKITGSAKGTDIFGSLGFDKIGNIFNQKSGGGILDMLGLGGGGGGNFGGLLSNIVGSAGGGGFGSILSGIGSLFGGFFADGGNPPVGKVSIVGERGPELFVPRSSGTILPNSIMQGVTESSKGNVIVNVKQSNSFESGVTEEKVGGIMKEHGKQIVKNLVDQIGRGGALRSAFHS